MTTTRIPTRADMITALNNPDPRNPLARAIAEAITSYSTAMTASVARNGGWTRPVVLPAPKTEIEAFALEMLTAELTATGIRVQIKGDS